MDDQFSMSAAVIAHWRHVRERQVRAAIASATLTFTGHAPTVLIDPTPAPEVLIGIALVEPLETTDDGVLIRAVTPAWRRFLNELAADPTAFMRLDPRQMEELIAGGYEEDGWRVELTPRSGDKGRDIIAFRDDIGAIRVLDQVKRYAPGHIVDATEVRAMFGVLHHDNKASKAILTTTSRFAPGVYVEFADSMPTRLELRNGAQVREWLQRIASKE